jgi:hypothetical protein
LPSPSSYDRGRYSLSRVQIFAWTIILIPLFAAVFVGRIVDHAGANGLQFHIPAELLAALGISLTSTVAAQAIKTTKDQTQPQSIPVSNPEVPPRLGQIFLVEQGDQADKVIDLTKFQNFWITVLVLGGYITTVISTVDQASGIRALVLPGFTGTLLTLLGISHVGYLAGKLPDRAGVPPGPTVLSTTNPEAVSRDPLLVDKAREPRYPRRIIPTPPPEARTRSAQPGPLAGEGR